MLDVVRGGVDWWGVMVVKVFLGCYLGRWNRLMVCVGGMDGG